MGKLFPSFDKPREDSSLGYLDKPITGHIFHTIEYELYGILQKIENIDNIDKTEIKDIILRQHRTILNYDLFLQDRKTRERAQTLFSNKKFLECFLDVIGLIELTHHERVCLNKLAYDYYLFPDKDEEVSNLLFQLTDWCNDTKEIAALSGIIGLNGARMLAMIRNSSFKEEKNVQRVNRFIVKCGIQLSVQNIIDIYCFLYKKITYLFVYTMLESCPDNLTNDEKNRFDAISIAILCILDSLPSNDIETVLLDYGYTLKMLHQQDIKVRFSIQSAKAYPRIISILRGINCGNDLQII